MGWGSIFGIGPEPIAAAPAAPPSSPPTKRSIYESRNNFGVNLGAAFVWESFMVPDFFINDTKAELEAIKAHVKSKGIKETRNMLINHYETFITDEDWSWLQSVGVTAVRIPFGYWIVDDGNFADNTPFESIKEVYKESWKYYKKYIETASKYDIGVVVDLHALPGGANDGDHSGTEDRNVEFWDHHENRHHAQDCVEFIAQDLRSFDNITGLQIVNESKFDNEAEKQKKYYLYSAQKIRQYLPTVPIIISDGWWTDQWVKWILEKEQELGGNNQTIGFVIDTHMYRCFSDDDTQKSPEQHLSELDSATLSGLSGEVDIMIGEYSCVLSEDSWSKVTSGSREEVRKQYGQKQYYIFKERAGCGSYFWSYKFQHGDGGEWGFRNMVEQGAIPQRPTRGHKLPSEDDFNQRMNANFQGHSNYWNGQNPNENWEHWRYQEGFSTGWADADAFYKFNASEIGRKHAWKNARRMEHISHRGHSDKIWEWDTGFDQGIREYLSAAWS